MSNKISKIQIKNVKGIDDKTFEFNLIPNKPNILVAPNGFGKSSFAIAFDSMNSNRIDLDDEHLHKRKSEHKPEVILSYDYDDASGCHSKTLRATDKQNDILKDFDVFVVNSQLIPKATKNNMGRFTTATASLEIKSIKLIDTIPSKDEIIYSCSTIRTFWGNNGKILENITSLFKEAKLMQQIGEIDFSKFTQIINSSKIETFVHSINTMTGTTQALKQSISTNMLNDLKSISEFDRLAKIIQNNNNLSILNETDAALAAWQVIKTYQQDHANFKKAIKYLAYLEEKESYGKIIHDFNSSWNEIKPKETKGSLVVEFPKAHYLSNGQRDILTFVLLLEKAKRKLKKSQCILIIDEIFDYLDEANLVAFQYYVTKMIDEFKSNNKYLYPLLLTHLNPNYFNHFCFSRHKLHVHFLDKRIYNDLSHLLTLIKKRNDPSIKDAVSQHHFHYNPVESDLEQQFANIGIRKEYAKSTSFYNFVHSEARKYISGTQSYDQLAVCFSVRIKIEEKIYSLLADEPHKNDFINKQRGTANKLNFASSIGVSVPETFFFLGLIYNDNLHQSSDNPNIVSALIVQLENITIKKIIKSVY